jgi:hypothetical protein
VPLAGDASDPADEAQFLVSAGVVKATDWGVSPALSRPRLSRSRTSGWPTSSTRAACRSRFYFAFKHDDDDPILRLDVEVDHDQPSPRPDDCPAISPYPGQLFACSWELFQSKQRSRDALPSVDRQLPRLDQRAKLIARRARDLDDGHR